MKPQILIVDDDPGIRNALSLLIEEDGRFSPLVAGNGKEALEALAREAVTLVLCDLAMPVMDGLSFLREARRMPLESPVVMVSANGEISTAVEAMRLGAYDYLVKPIDEKRLWTTVQRALELVRLEQDLTTLKEAHREDLLLIGDSAPMRTLRREIELAAPSDARILILGENGTGKELVAKLLHERSARSARPFIKLNSAALPRDLIESELFGHEAGAFTGAQKARKGKFELADGGTLFLDEVGDMAADTQAKLLRVLSSGELERVGGSKSVSFDVRLLAATNRDLEIEIEEGRFREDLFHRIAVIPIRVPPLRERGTDVEDLATHFLTEFCARYGRRPPLLETEARSLLRRYAWPGNVRELRNLMERIAIMHPESNVTGEDLSALIVIRRGGTAPSATSPVLPTGGLVEHWKAEQREEDRSRVEQTLKDAGWNVTLAAERLGIDRASLHRKMRRLGVARPGRSLSDPD
ncbi:MAG: sigma-54-dependent Fis family transcriptional regulator [Candidatus Eisenbacteria bacterium]|nr:sigma-54-dependent Fis family transcriptional regulator [Candidatus Eisenbacteria bacterium]